MHHMSETTYAGWPLIEINGVGPDGTCHCFEGANCKPGSRGKHPRRKDWQKSERVDVGEMLRRRPRANLGTLTGAPAGFWVLDIDESGMDAMRDLRAQHGPLPSTRVHKTGGGTFHYFFTMPDFPVTNSAGRLPKGIDVRGTGGQVVLPPSVSAKGEYAVVRDEPIVAAPDWLLDMIRPTETSAPTVDGFLEENVPSSAELIRHAEALDAEQAQPVEQSPRERKYEASIVEGEIARLVKMTKSKTPDPADYKGEPWDWTTFMVACQLIELANADWTTLTVDEARAIVMEHAPHDDGFDYARISAKVDSAIKKVGDKARPAPVDTTSWMDDIEESLPTSPTATPSQKESVPREFEPEDYFGKNGLNSVDLGMSVMQFGPIMWGQNQRWWTYDDRGVWVEDRNAIRNRTIKILGNRYRGSHATNAEDIVHSLADVLVIDDPDPRLINFRNGMLEWKTGELHPHAPEVVSTVQIPHHFEPDATCPKFDAFLNSVMSPDYQRLVWEMIGYLLYSGNPLQIAFLLHGSGGNGKGTLIKVITAMLGAENLAHQSLDALNGDKFAAANLFGKIANIAGDIDATFQESTARFKMLTGEDRFSGEYKYGDSFGFNNFAVPLFSANKIPGSADVSKGYLRRWVNIEFDRQFKGDPIAGLGEMLAATEIPGVIAKGLAHLGPLLAQGRFTVQGEAEKGRDEFAKSIDQVRQWAEEETMPVDNGPVKRDDLYRDYRQWAERNGTGKLKAADFYARLEGAGYTAAKVNGMRVFKGISIIQSKPDGLPHRPVNTSWVDEVEA